MNKSSLINASSKKFIGRVTFFVARWIMITMLLSYIDENITMSLEAVLMKKSPCKWKRYCRKYCRVRGSRFDEKSLVDMELIKNTV